MEIQLTKIELEHRLEISPMTLYLWQKGSDTTPPLPHVKIPKGSKNTILFCYEEVLKWLIEYRPALVAKLGVPCGCKRCARNDRVQNNISSSLTRSDSIVALT